MPFVVLMLLERVLRAKVAIAYLAGGSCMLWRVFLVLLQCRLISERTVAGYTIIHRLFNVNFCGVFLIGIVDPRKELGQ